MSGTPGVHRGSRRPAERSHRRGVSVPLPDLTGFLIGGGADEAFAGGSSGADERHSAEVSRRISTGGNVFRLRAVGDRFGEYDETERRATEGVGCEPFVAPTARVALLHVGSGLFESTVAMAVALACEAAAGSGAPGAVVTADASRLRLSSGRRGHSVALRGFEATGRAGPVTLLDAIDAEPASIAANGTVPIVCVLDAAESPAGRITGICPSSLLIVAGPEVDDGYLGLLASELSDLSTAATARVLRYAPSGSALDLEPTLAYDRSAALRLRLALAPGPRSRANAEIAVAALARA